MSAIIINTVNICVVSTCWWLGGGVRCSGDENQCSDLLCTILQPMVGVYLHCICHIRYSESVIH